MASQLKFKKMLLDKKKSLMMRTDGRINIKSMIMSIDYYNSLILKFYATMKNALPKMIKAPSSGQNSLLT